MNFLPDIKTLIHEALREDLGSGDITTNILVDSQTQAVGELVAKQDGILCGIEISKEVFLTVDPSLDINIFYSLRYSSNVRSSYKKY